MLTNNDLEYLEQIEKSISNGFIDVHLNPLGRCIKRLMDIIRRLRVMVSNYERRKA